MDPKQPITRASALPPAQKAEFEAQMLALRQRYGPMPVLLAAQFVNVTTALMGLSQFQEGLTPTDREELLEQAGQALSTLITVCNAALGMPDAPVMRCVEGIREISGLLVDDLHSIASGSTIDLVAAEAIRQARGKA